MFFGELSIFVHQIPILKQLKQVHMLQHLRICNLMLQIPLRLLDPCHSHLCQTASSGTKKYHPSVLLSLELLVSSQQERFFQHCLRCIIVAFSLRYGDIQIYDINTDILVSYISWEYSMSYPCIYLIDFNTFSLKCVPHAHSVKKTTKFRSTIIFIYWASFLSQRDFSSVHRL